MKDAGGGRIINLASIMGAVGYYNRAAYCSSKAGIVNLTRVLAIEWAPYGINRQRHRKVGIILTSADPVLVRRTHDIRQDLLARIPLGRVGMPEDVTGAAVFLASDAAGLITGQTLYVDGGWTAI